ncbi:hypothetical protein B0H14DRAFT_2634282 [Mycena olivaceomarginata]|nr:hypothetical protein B0H14DRAFT_2634282 [Mycena olivaceomarginata]
MPAKKAKNKEHPDTSSQNQVLSAKERHAQAQARCRAHWRAYIKSSELSRQAAETCWGIDKEYREIKRMRWDIITIILQQTATSLPKNKLARAVVFLRLVPNGQRLANQKKLEADVKK